MAEINPALPFSLLSTKLYIPPPGPNVIRRPHLTARLMSMLERPGCFSLLAGPAGFGKTSLLSEFAAQLRRLAAWLSLDEADNDPSRFWSYLISACQAAQPALGEAALELLRGAPGFPGELIPTLLINDLAQLGAPLVLILDDFHTIHEAAIHAGILYLLEHTPPNLHLVIAARSDPPLPLARFRARRQLIEIRAAELRFSLPETSEFLNRGLGLGLSGADLAALEERTEGWPAGLQLAALSMQDRPDLSAFIRAFTGSHAYIAEYLVDEVLQRQSPDMQAFLLKTALLDQFCAGLCDAVTASADGQASLKALRQANLFLVPLDDEAHWFRYHHLFADLLKARLRGGLAKAELAELHRRAAEWYAQNAMPAEAIDHFITARDYPRAVEWLEKIALPTILQASIRSLERWLRDIPAAFYEQNIPINLACAWMNLIRGTPLQSAPYIERLRPVFTGAREASLDAALRAEWLAIQVELLIAQGRPAEGRDLAQKAQPLLPAVDPAIRGMIAVALAKAYQLTLDYERAAEVFQLIVQDARRAGDITFEVLGISGEAQMTLKQGRLRRTFELARQGIEHLEQSGKKVPFGATLYGELGQVYFAWGKFDQARDYFQRSKELSGKSGYSDPEIYYHLMLAKICQMQGDPAGALAEMEQANLLASAVPPAMVRESLIAQQVMVELAAGRAAAAEQCLAAEGFQFGGAFQAPEPAPGAPFTLETGLLYNSALRVLLQHAREKPGATRLETGIELAGRLLTAELESGLAPSALETLLLRAQMQAAAGQGAQSLSDLAAALELGEPEGFISPFIQEGPPLRALLIQQAQTAAIVPPRPEYLQEILAAFPGAPGLPPTASEPLKGTAPEGSPALVEPLTARELEVLRHVANGDSNAAIAAALVISLSAVKKHTGNIYAKLGVNSRTQALLRARQLGLLSTEE